MCCSGLLNQSIVRASEDQREEGQHASPIAHWVQLLSRYQAIALTL